MGILGTLKMKDLDIQQHLDKLRKENNKMIAAKFLMTVAVIAIKSLIIMLCWNFLASDLVFVYNDSIISLPKINYWHGLALFVICNYLFKGTEEKSKSFQNVIDQEKLKKIIDELELKKRQLFN